MGITTQPANPGPALIYHTTKTKRYSSLYESVISELSFQDEQDTQQHYLPDSFLFGFLINCNIWRERGHRGGEASQVLWQEDCMLGHDI